jgi:hypothetical protein
MAIRLGPPAADDQGLPAVNWEEDRNLFAPGGVTPAPVSCFIRPDAGGVLQFVSVGLVRHGRFEEERPWEALKGFAVERADQHYYSGRDRALLEHLASKSKSGVGRLLTADGAFVIVATFGDEQRSVPMHLNCADCTPVEAAMLHDRLRFEFLDRKWDLIDKRCNGEFVWPKDKPFIPYTPPAPTPSSWWMARLADVLIMGIFGSIAVALYLFLRG